MIVLYVSSRVFISAPQFAANVFTRRWKYSDLNLFMCGFHVSQESKVRPRSLIVLVSFSSCPLRLSRMLVGCLRLLNVNTTNLELENLKPVFSDHFWRLFKLFWSNNWVVSGFLPLHIIVRSSTNRNPLIGSEILIITSFMAMRNRLTLRTEPCGTPFSIGEEREFATLTWMVLE